MRRLLLISFILILFLPLTDHDTLRISPVAKLAARYQFNLAGWEVAHLPDKWLRELKQLAFPFAEEAAEDPHDVVVEYFSLASEVRRLSSRLDQAVASGEGDQAGLERQLREVKARRDALRPNTEQVLEAEVSTVLREEGIPSRIGGLLFPPVDFALAQPPRLLAVSPRDRIRLTETILLVPDISIEQREALEERILHEQNLSALVLDIGGLATYPGIINATTLRFALTTAFHEWLHQYLFFRPLGQNLARDDDMITLNETTADLFGEELGNRLYTSLTGEEVPLTGGANEEPCREPRFCFDQEMRRTRFRVDELLAQGNVPEAEAYMEQRRQLFVQNGYNIRKLNQAFFARHGVYGDSPESISPIYEQILELRRLSDSSAEFIHTVSDVSSYQEFTALFQQMRGQRPLKTEASR